MTSQDLTGSYNIIGKNQADTDVTYRGTLELRVDDNGSIIAKWLIHNSQEQTGIGFFKDNTLTINFQYLGEDEEIYKGVVVYKCITKDILEGFWSEEYGDPRFLGEERCFRVKDALLD